MRSMASGAAYHRTFLRATQQAFLEAQQMAFHYFGGCFRRLRYDNLSSAVKKILRSKRRPPSLLRVTGNLLFELAQIQTAHHSPNSPRYVLLGYQPLYIHSVPTQLLPIHLTD